MAISTWLMMLITNIYTLWGLPFLLLPLTYFNIFNKLIYPTGYKKSYKDDTPNKTNTNYTSIKHFTVRATFKTSS